MSRRSRRATTSACRGTGRPPRGPIPGATGGASGGASSPRLPMPRTPRSLAVIRRAAGHRPPTARALRIAPRSAAALAPATGWTATAPTPAAATTTALPALAVVPPPDRGPEPRRLAALRRRLAALAAASLVVSVAALAAGGTRVVLATFTDQAAVAATFGTGTWTREITWYLHNQPTPPTGNTTARTLLGMDEVEPTAGTLFNYDTNCDSRPGRLIQRGTGLVTEAGTCRAVTWRSATLGAGRTLDGTARLAIWARKTSSGGTNPTLRAFLRVFHPSTSTYVELGAANTTVAANGNQPWVELDLAWSLANVTVPADRQVEVKLVATGGNRNVEIAYDVDDLASALTLP